MSDQYPDRDPSRPSNSDPSRHERPRADSPPPPADSPPPPADSPPPPADSPPPPADSPPPPGQPSDDHDVEAVLAGAGDFTSGEGLVAFAGIVLLIVWIVFDVFLDGYGLGSLTILLAATVVIVPRLDPDVVDRAAHGPTVMKVGGYAIAILGAITLIGDIENTALDSVGAILGGLISYGAYAMAFVGARQIET